MSIEQAKKIYIAGHLGMVGSALLRVFSCDLSAIVITRNRNSLDLTNQAAVCKFFKDEEIDEVYLAAAKVGGIYANNTYPAEFIYENLMIEANIINASFKSGVKKLLFLGSSCIYPKHASQPIKEKYLLTGLLEETNEPYAIAKIAGIKLCESYNRQYGKSHGIDYRSVMPTNLYGIGDNYHPENSHVIPALIYRFHQAKINKNPSVTIWGTGRPRREFLYVDDMALACVHVMNIGKSLYEMHTKKNLSHINVGIGYDMTISELANIIKKYVNYKGKIKFNENHLDGAPRKMLDVNIINSLGWNAQVDLKDGITITYKDYCDKLQYL